MTAAKGGDERPIWYAGFGSNLWWDRFRCYLEGGVPPGSQREQPGARNPAPPRDDAPCEIGHQLFFAGQSRTWGGGGIAFVDKRAKVGTALARRWLITRGQLADVVAQERGEQPAYDLSLATLVAHGHQRLANGAYDLLLLVGQHDDVPVVTLTTSRDRQEMTMAAPSQAYANTLVQGLVESHGLTPTEARQYVTAASAHGG